VVVVDGECRTEEPVIAVRGLVAVSLQRTAIGTWEQPPPSFGALPMVRMGPAEVIAPLPAEEAVWIGITPLQEFGLAAIRAGAIGDGPVVDIITGASYVPRPLARPQNYIVSPIQRSIDGVPHEAHKARQLVRHSVVEGTFKCTRTTVTVAPFRGKAPIVHLNDLRPVLRGASSGGRVNRMAASSVPCEVVRDPFGLSSWDFESSEGLSITFVSPQDYFKRTGHAFDQPLDEQSRYHGWRFP